jgi:hypothetical protein
MPESEGLHAAIVRLCAEAEAAIKAGNSVCSIVG